MKDEEIVIDLTKSVPVHVGKLDARWMLWVANCMYIIRDFAEAHPDDYEKYDTEDIYKWMIEKGREK